MINLETREKLGNLDLFKNNCFFRGRCLPNPTVGELIEAVDEKTNFKWGLEREKKKNKWLVWFEIEEIKSYFAQDNLDNCLAKALIWLSGQEEQC